MGSTPRPGPTRLRPQGLVAPAGAALATLTLTLVGVAPAHAAKVRGAGRATVVSVDGPARLTIKTKGGRLRLRLFPVDAPKPGECGAAESVAALEKLTTGRGRRFRYELLSGGSRSYERDAEGRYLGFLSPPGEDGFFSGVAQDLVDLGWARNGEALTSAQGPISHGDVQYGGAGPGGGAPRTPRGLWARCGGRVHLPSDQPVPAHAPATWTITSDGITEAVGPLTLSPTLSPATNLTIAQVARVAPVELVDVGSSECRASVPSLEIVLSAETSAQTPCGSADVYAVVTSGPGAATTTRGVGVGSPLAAAKITFPRAAVVGNDDDVQALRLSGTDTLPWAWQTQAGLDENGSHLDLLYTTAGPGGD